MLVSAYLGQHPDKVDHAVLAEPGFLTPEFADIFFEKTRIRFSPGVLFYFLKTKFESLHVKGPDDHAADDFVGHQINMYPGSDHPQAGYRCAGVGPEETDSWRFGARAADSLFQQAVDAEGNFTIDFTTGVGKFTNKVLFMAGECQTLIGGDWQRQQMEFFPDAELVVIPAAGHEMFAENPQASIAAVREYLDVPTR
jgi:proline iminopeptidase